MDEPTAGRWERWSGKYVFPDTYFALSDGYRRGVPAAVGLGTLYRDALWRNPSALDYLHQRASRTGLSARADSGTLTAAHSRRICVSTAVCALPKTLACFGVRPGRVAGRCANSSLGRSSCPIKRQPANLVHWPISERTPGQGEVPGAARREADSS